MIGALPMTNLAPLEYRAALDAALVILYPQYPITIRCSVPELAREAHQRIPIETDETKAGPGVVTG